MKNTYIGEIVLTATLLLLIALGVGVMFGILADFDESTRYAKAQVVEIDGQVVTLMTADGNLWEYETTTNCFVGEVVKICFLTNKTETIYDDVISYVRGMS